MAGRGGAAASSRGRGGKFKKYTRGGGKHFSRDLQPIDSEGNQISMWASGARKRGEDDDDDDDDDSDEEESDSDEEDEDDSKPAAGSTAAEDASREDRKAQKKARKEAAIARQRAHTVEVGDMPSSDESEDDDMPANPNHSKAARKQATSAAAGAATGVEEITEGVSKMKAPASRREREAMEAAAAKERYMKLHAAGKTDEAKADLARLRLIREQRATEAARRQAEKEEREEKEKERRAEIEAREAKKRAAAAGPKKGKK
jgi:hypothetical protein